MKIDNYFRVVDVVRQLVARGISLCDTFEDWTTLAFALSELGEDGLDLFLQLSRIGDGYKSDIECEKKFRNCIRSRRGNLSLGTFFHKAEAYGITARCSRNESHTYSAPTRHKVAPANETFNTLPIEVAMNLRKQSYNITLCSLFKEKFGKSSHAFPDRVESVFNDYLVGTLNQYTVFWQIDQYSKIRTGKCICYGNDGKRSREINPNWFHSIAQKECTKLEGFRMRQCAFGLHLVGDNGQFQEKTPVLIVESEKNALAMAIVERCYYMGFVCVSVGSKTNFNKNMLEPLKGCHIIVLPDHDAEMEWRETCNNLPNDWFRSIRFLSDVNVLAEKLEVPGDLSKVDIADVILQGGNEYDTPLEVAKWIESVWKSPESRLK